MAFTTAKNVLLTTKLNCKPRISSWQPRRPSVSARAVVRVTAASSETGIQMDKSTPESVWKERLSNEEYYVLRGKGTERPGTGKYNKFFENGVYHCAGCGAPLFTSEHKFDSGCGWPAFYDEIPGAVDRHVDSTLGMRRVEITCSKCGGHLGHVFEGEGFPNPKDQRHCVNSISIKFQPKSDA